MSRLALYRLRKQSNLLFNTSYRCFTQAKTSKKNELTIDLENTSDSAISAFKTLYMRYQDTLDPKPILNDKLSSQYLNSFVYSKQHLPPAFPAVSSVLEPYRAKIIDMNVIQWIETRYANHIINIENKTKDMAQIQSKDKSHKCVLHIIELGVGFDTRLERIFLSQNILSKRVEHEDYFMNTQEFEKEKIQEDNATDFQDMFDKMPSFAEMDNTISYNDYDIVYFYEIDLNQIIDLRKKLVHKNKIDALIDKHNNEILVNEDENEYDEDQDEDSQFTPKLMQNLHKKVYRKMYSYSVHDRNWFEQIRNDIMANHEKETGKIMKNFTNVCIVSESLFLFMQRHEMKDLIERLCNNFTGAQLICDESFTNEGLMNIEKEILKENPLSYDVKNKVFLLKIEEVNQRLSFLVRWTVGYLTKNNYKILVVQFLKPVQCRMEQTQL